jgi:hypothetical protein
MSGVAIVLPGGDFVDEVCLSGDAAIETLERQNAEFGLRQIDWSVVPFEAFDQPPGFGGRKGFIVKPCCGC